MNSVANFDELRNLTYTLQKGEVHTCLGKKSLNALTSMIDKPDMVATCNIVKLSEQLSLSPASITRIAKQLGFTGFNQFQEIFRLRSELLEDFYSQKANKLKSLNNLPQKTILNKQLLNSVSNMQSCIGKIENTALDLAVRMLARAPSVHIFGHKQASAVANVLSYGLKLVRKKINGLRNEEQGIALALGQIQTNDLVVMLGTSPYSEQTIRVSRAVRSLNCQILAISDSPNSPLFEQATAALLVPTSSDFYNNSLSATIILIESLLILVSIELGETAVMRLEKHEALVRKLQLG